MTARIATKLNRSIWTATEVEGWEVSIAARARDGERDAQFLKYATAGLQPGASHDTARRAVTQLRRKAVKPPV